MLMFILSLVFFGLLAVTPLLSVENQKINENI